MTLKRSSVKISKAVETKPFTMFAAKKTDV